MVLVVLSKVGQRLDAVRAVSAGFAVVEFDGQGGVGDVSHRFPYADESSRPFRGERLGLDRGPVTNTLHAPPTTSANTLGFLSIGAVLGAVGSAAYLSTFFIYTDDPQFVEIVRSPLVVTAFWLMFAGLSTVGLALPAATGNRLPDWAVYVTAASFIASAAQAFTTGTAVADFARLVTEEEMQEGTNTVLNFLMGVPHGLLGVVGFIALGIYGRRGGLFGIGLLVLFIVSGVASLLWHVPPAGLLGSVAVLGLVQALRKPGQTRPAS
jgi:hypothetical protein